MKPPRQPEMVVDVPPEEHDPSPLMIVDQDVVLPLGALQAVILMLAVVVACVVLLRRHPLDDAAPDDR